jgi:hypothetical protein
MECQLSKEGFLPVEVLGRNNNELRKKMVSAEKFAKNGAENIPA